MFRKHTSYVIFSIEFRSVRHYIMCMRERTNTYMGTFPADVCADNSQLYAELLRNVRAINYGMRGTGRKFALRKRYRGTRDKTRRNNQSMCLRSEANRCDVYLYCERVSYAS